MNFYTAPMNLNQTFLAVQKKNDPRGLQKLKFQGFLMEDIFLN